MGLLTDDIFTADNLLHAIGSVVVTGVVVVPAVFHAWTLSFTVPLAMLAWGYVREVAQSDNDWLAPLQSFHKFAEAVSWPLASMLVSVPVALIWG